MMTVAEDTMKMYECATRRACRTWRTDTSIDADQAPRAKPNRRPRPEGCSADQ